MLEPRDLRGAARSTAWLAIAYAVTVVVHELAHAAAAIAVGANDVRISYGHVAHDPPAGASGWDAAAILAAGPLATALQVVVFLLLARRRSRTTGLVAATWLATVATAHLGTSLVLGILGSDVGRLVDLVPGDPVVLGGSAAMAGGLLLSSSVALLAPAHERCAQLLLAHRPGSLVRALLFTALPWLLGGILLQLLLFDSAPAIAHVLMSVPAALVVAAAATRREQAATEPEAARLPVTRHGRWTSALAAFVVAVVAWRLLTILFRIAAGDASTLPLVSVFINGVAGLVALMLAGIVGGWSAAQLGLAWRGALRQLGIGALLGVGAAAVTVGVLVALHAVHAHDDASAITHQPLAAVIAFFVLASISEELLFRGILFGLGRELVGPWAAAVLSSAAFALVHAANPAASYRSMAVTMLAGLVLAALVQLTGALWAAYAFHLSWNLVIGIGTGLPVSGIDVGPGIWPLGIGGRPAFDGGGYGPEGGVVALVTLLLLALGLGAALVVRSRAAADPSPGPAPPPGRRRGGAR